MYAFWLGGKDHYPADRAAGQEVARLRPQVVAAARANRGFGCRVTGYAASGLRIQQFLDVGAGLPAPGPARAPPGPARRGRRMPGRPCRGWAWR